MDVSVLPFWPRDRYIELAPRYWRLPFSVMGVGREIRELAVLGVDTIEVDHMSTGSPGGAFLGHN
jgi:hypothetical protein